MFIKYEYITHSRGLIQDEGVPLIQNEYLNVLIDYDKAQ